MAAGWPLFFDNPAGKFPLCPPQTFTEFVEVVPTFPGESVAGSTSFLNDRVFSHTWHAFAARSAGLDPRRWGAGSATEIVRPTSAAAHGADFYIATWADVLL